MRTLLVAAITTIACTFQVALAQTSQPPKAAAANGGWITDYDYPARSVRAGEEGIVGFTLFNDAIGRVAKCRIDKSSGFVELDEATCVLLTRRALFIPNKNVPKGSAFNGQFSSRVQWKLPVEAATAPATTPSPSSESENMTAFIRRGEIGGSGAQVNGTFYYYCRETRYDEPSTMYFSRIMLDPGKANRIPGSLFQSLEQEAFAKKFADYLRKTQGFEKGDWFPYCSTGSRSQADTEAEIQSEIAARGHQVRRNVFP